MAKIIGNTTVTPVMPADWEQTDEKRVDYIKNKPTKLSQFDNDIGYIKEEELGAVDSALDAILAIQNELIGGDSE